MNQVGRSTKKAAATTTGPAAVAAQCTTPAQNCTSDVTHAIRAHISYNRITGKIQLVMRLDMCIKAGQGFAYISHEIQQGDDPPQRLHGKGSLRRASSSSRLIIL